MGTWTTLGRLPGPLPTQSHRWLASSWANTQEPLELSPFTTVDSALLPIRDPGLHQKRSHPSSFPSSRNKNQRLHNTQILQQSPDLINSQAHGSHGLRVSELTALHRICTAIRRREERRAVVHFHPDYRPQPPYLITSGEHFPNSSPMNLD